MQPAGGFNPLVLRAFPEADRGFPQKPASASGISRSRQGVFFKKRRVLRAFPEADRGFLQKTASASGISRSTKGVNFIIRSNVLNLQPFKHLSMSDGKFNSIFGSILALAGSAVGLGNIWRFPYMVGEYGGAAFILIYILCMILVSMPIMLSEFIVGRRSRCGAFSAVGKLCPQGPWKHYGILAVLIPFSTLCYYIVIGGWTLGYLVKSVAGEFTAGTDPVCIESGFGAFVSSPSLSLICMAVFLLLTFAVILMGVEKGIEKCSKVMMPLLFVIMIVIAIRTVTLPGASDGVTYLFKPDFSKITPEVFLRAMGQAFYSLSVGMGIMITYSSYLPKKANLVKSAASTICADFVFALIAAVAIIPALFAFNMPTGQGTGLVFKTLPIVFTMMPMGSIVAVIFFFAVLLAALTSSMSLFEVPVGWLIESRRMSRRKACITVFIATMAVGSICALSFGPLAHIHLGNLGIFDAFDYIIGNYLMPFCGLVLVLFVGWKMKRDDKKQELFGDNLTSTEKTFYSVLEFLIRYVAPVAVISIFLSGILL